MSSQKRNTKDFILLVVYGLSFGFIMCSRVSDWTKFFDYLNDFIILLLFYATWIEVARVFNLTVLVPDVYLRSRELRSNEVARVAIESYFEEDIAYIKMHDSNRIEFFMSQLGISKEKFECIRFELRRLQLMSHGTVDESRTKLCKIIKSELPVVINQKDIPQGQIKYNKVKYFINFIDIMPIQQYASELGGMFATLISETYLKNELDLSSVDRIVLPHDSNYLLASDVSRRLNIPLVKMRPEDGRVVKDQCWDGTLKVGENVIIIHDVLVTASQVEHALVRLKDLHCTCKHFFCLVCRTDPKFNGKKSLEESKVKVHSLLDLCDDDIVNLRSC